MGVSRRAVVMLGAASLLSACAGPPTAVWHGNGELPGDSHQDGQSSGEASPEPSWEIPAANPPTSGVCPTTPGVVQHQGGPQFYLPCHGTDIALTIDDGPDPKYTPRILALLAKHNVTATFCMIGSKVAGSHSIVADVLGAGHHVANHTYSHPMDLVKLPKAKLHDEIANASDAIATAAGGRGPTLFRAPGAPGRRRCWPSARRSTCGRWTGRWTRGTGAGPACSTS